MVKVVIESPCSGDFLANRRYALWCALHCYTRGEAAFASHLLYTQFLDDENPEHREFGIVAGYAWAQNADLFAFYTDLGESGGMRRARQRWSGRTMDTRKLPDDMLAAFKDGVSPTKTQGF